MISTLPRCHSEMRPIGAIMRPIHQICLYFSRGFDWAEFSNDPGQLISIFGSSPVEVTLWHCVTAQTALVYDEGLYSLKFCLDDLGFNTGSWRREDKTANRWRGSLHLKVKKTQSETCGEISESMRMFSSASTVWATSSFLALSHSHFLPLTDGRNIRDKPN